MRYLSLCSGIEAASVAWEPLGWEPVAFAEIEPFPSAVLKAHYPDIPNLGDITKFMEWPDDLGPIDLVCGGTPCQSFSVAGLRQGLADPRGNLMLTYLAIVGRYRPRWCLWENVPGVLSSNQGSDFASLLFGLGEMGYGWAYRVLDAQYVRVDGFPRAVPQRRRRVFVVGCLGSWQCAAAVLSERESLLGDTPPRRTAGQRVADSLTVGANQCSGTRSDFTHDIAPTIPARSTAGGGLGTDFDSDGGLIAGTLTDRPYADNAGQADRLVAVRLTSFGEYVDDGTASTVKERDDGTANAVLTPSGGRAGIGVGAVAIQARASTDLNAGPGGKGWRDDGAAFTMEVSGGPQAVAIHADAVSRSGDAVTATRRPGIGMIDDGSAYTVMADAQHAVAFAQNQQGEVRTSLVSPSLNTGGGKPGEGYSAVAIGIDSECNAYADMAGSLTQNSPSGGGHPAAVAFTASDQAMGRYSAWETDVYQTLQAQPQSDTSNIQKGIRQGYAVRHLTPRECERLQGFPDDYTLVEYRGKPAADGPRYRALGNAWAVNCARWVGRRIEMVEAILAREVAG